MRHYLTIACIALLCISCSPDGGSGPDPSGSLLLVKHGTFFGECLGYCRSEMTIEPSTATLVRSSWNNVKFPDQSAQHAIADQDWNGLVAAADIDAMMGLDSIIGCPDCADGGGEWIEVQRGNKVKRVVFPYHDSLPAINDLLAKVRAIRATFKD